MKDQMAQYLNFEEVAAELKCSLAKVRQLVLEDKSLKATRITPNGMVLPPSSPDDSLVCNLDFTSHVSDAGAISADDYGRDATGKTGRDAKVRRASCHWSYAASRLAMIWPESDRKGMKSDVRYAIRH
jgi:hypothetical protein